jgi:hypothetical protein
MRSAREGQTEEPRHFVERLPGRIVERGTERRHVESDVIDSQERCVTARDQERDGRLGDVSVDESIHRDVSSQVIDAVDRTVKGDREALRCTDADKKCADETRTGGHRDGIDIAQRDTRLRRRTIKSGVEGLQVSSAGNLGHDSTESSLLIDARCDGIKEKCAPAHQGDAGLVAGRLDPQHQGFVTHGRLLRMMKASCPGP